MPRNASRATLLMVGASALIAATSPLAKELGSGGGEGQGLHALQISAGRFVFALLALIALLAVSPRLRPTFEGARWGWHFARAMCGWLGVTCLFAAVTQMPVADATAISFLSPIVTVVLAAVMLGEGIRLRTLGAIVLAVAGAVLVLRPGSGVFQSAGMFALAAAALFGAEAIFIKKLSDAEPALRILVVSNAICAGAAGLVALLVWVWPSPVQWLLLMALGTVMVLGQALFLQAMRRGEASTVIPVFYSVLIFAALYDWTIYAVVPKQAALLGAALIVLAAMMLTRPSRP